MTPVRAGVGDQVERRAVLSGIGFVLLAYALFSAMDGMAKWLTGGYAVPQILFTNAVFGMLAVLVLTPFLGGWQVLRTRRLRWQLLRGVIAVSGGFGGFLAFSRMPMADVYALIFAAPLLICALSVPLLGEAVGWRRWLAIAGGFCGVLIMLRPGQGMIDLGAFGGLAAALTHAIAVLIVRRLSTTEAPISFAFYTNMVGLVLGGSLMLAVGPKMPTLPDLALSAGCGIAGGLGLLCIASGFSRAPAAILAPFQYTQMLWGVLAGHVVFGDEPDLWLAVGGGIVIGSGLYILHREARSRELRPVVASTPATAD